MGFFDSLKFEKNLHLWVLQKAEIAFSKLKWLMQFQLFEKLTPANSFEIELKTV